VEPSSVIFWAIREGKRIENSTLRMLFSFPEFGVWGAGAGVPYNQAIVAMSRVLEAIRDIFFISMKFPPFEGNRILSIIGKLNT
jgi:hypothetical protein